MVSRCNFLPKNVIIIQTLKQTKPAIVQYILYRYIIISENFLVYYGKYCNLIGYATHYLVVNTIDIE